MLLSLKIKADLDWFSRMALTTLANEHRVFYNHLLGKVKSGELGNTLRNSFRQYMNERNHTMPKECIKLAFEDFLTSVRSIHVKRGRNNSFLVPLRFKPMNSFKAFRIPLNGHGKGFCYSNDLKKLLFKRNGLSFSVKLPSIALRAIGQGNRLREVLVEERQGDIYFIIRYKLPKPKDSLPPRGHALGIDPGLNRAVTCFSTTGQSFAIEMSRFSKLERRMSVLKYHMNRKKKGSNKWTRLEQKYQRCWKKLYDKQKDFFHKVSNYVIEFCLQNGIRSIVMGDMCIRKSRRKKVLHPLVPWATVNQDRMFELIKMVEYKTLNAGLDFYLVDESGTSVTNCLTDQKMESVNPNRKHFIISDGLTIDRDLNGAINILKRQRGQWSSHLTRSNLTELIQPLTELCMDSHSRIGVKS